MPGSSVLPGSSPLSPSFLPGFFFSGSFCFASSRPSALGGSFHFASSFFGDPPGRPIDLSPPASSRRPAAGACGVVGLCVAGLSLIAVRLGLRSRPLRRLPRWIAVGLSRILLFLALSLTARVVLLLFVARRCLASRYHSGRTSSSGRRFFQAFPAWMAICRRDSVPGRPDGSLVPACRYSSPCPAVGPGHYPIWIFSDSRPRAFRDLSPAAPIGLLLVLRIRVLVAAVVALAPDHCRRAVSPDFCGRAFAALRECRRVSVPRLTILAVLGFLYGVVGLDSPGGAGSSCFPRCCGSG